SRRRHTRSKRDWSSDVCSSDLNELDRPGLGFFFIPVSIFGIRCIHSGPRTATIVGILHYDFKIFTVILNSPNHCVRDRLLRVIVTNPTWVSRQVLKESKNHEDQHDTKGQRNKVNEVLEAI